MLEALGLTDTDSKVYELVLTHPTWSQEDIARQLQLPENRVAGSTARLEERGLLRRLHDSPEILPLDPDDALDELIAEAEFEAARRRRLAATIRRKVSPLLGEYVHHQLAGEAGDTRRLTAREPVDLLHARLLGVARRSIQIMHPVSSPDTDTIRRRLPRELKALERGARLQVIFAAGGAPAAERWEYARQLTESGGESRVATSVPLRLVLVDRRVSLVDGASGDNEQALVLHGPTMTAVLGAVFDCSWETASALPATDDPQDDPLTDAERELLYLLSLGAKDEAAARQLGVSVRTVRRLVSGLLDRLQATSRFQAGVRAAERGWVQHRSAS